MLHERDARQRNQKWEFMSIIKTFNSVDFGDIQNAISSSIGQVVNQAETRNLG